LGPLTHYRDKTKTEVSNGMKPLHNRFGYNYLLSACKLTSFIHHIVRQKQSLFSSSLSILGLFALYIETSPSVSITIPHFAWQLLLNCLSLFALSLFSFFFSSVLLRQADRNCPYTKNHSFSGSNQGVLSVIPIV